MQRGVRSDVDKRLSKRYLTVFLTSLHDKAVYRPSPQLRNSKRATFKDLNFHFQSLKCLTFVFGMHHLSPGYADLTSVDFGGESERADSLMAMSLTR